MPDDIQAAGVAVVTPTEVCNARLTWRRTATPLVRRQHLASRLAPRPTRHVSPANAYVKIDYAARAGP